jgi:hypothetical protein
LLLFSYFGTYSASQPTGLSQVGVTPSHAERENDEHENCAICREELPPDIELLASDFCAKATQDLNLLRQNFEERMRSLQAMSEGSTLPEGSIDSGHVSIEDAKRVYEKSLEACESVRPAFRQYCSTAIANTLRIIKRTTYREILSLRASILQYVDGTAELREILTNSLSAHQKYLALINTLLDGDGGYSEKVHKSLMRQYRRIYGKMLAQSIRKGLSEETAQVVFPCKHRLHKRCFSELIAHGGKDTVCPLCRTPYEDMYAGDEVEQTEKKILLVFLEGISLGRYRHQITVLCRSVGYILQDPDTIDRFSRALNISTIKSINYLSKWKNFFEQLPSRLDDIGNLLVEVWPSWQVADTLRMIFVENDLNEELLTLLATVLQSAYHDSMMPSLEGWWISAYSLNALLGLPHSEPRKDTLLHRQLASIITLYASSIESWKLKFLKQSISQRQESIAMTLKHESCMLTIGWLLILSCILNMYLLNAV